jgi:hypothetical protein
MNTPQLVTMPAANQKIASFTLRISRLPFAPPGPHQRHQLGFIVVLDGICHHAQKRRRVLLTCRATVAIIRQAAAQARCHPLRYA